MQVPHRHNIRLLQKEANHWWQLMEKSAYNQRAIASITQLEFVISFNEQYFSKPAIHRKALEFNNLTQGNDLVWEYAKKSWSWSNFLLDRWTMKKLGVVHSFGDWGLKWKTKLLTSLGIVWMRSSMLQSIMCWSWNKRKWPGRVILFQKMVYNLRMCLSSILNKLWRLLAI